MSERLSDLVDELVRQPESEFDSGKFNLLEKEGDAAFELVRLRVHGLHGIERARAINLLLMLTRQFCFQRLPDAVRTALSFTDSDDPIVRSAAVSASVRGTRVLPAFRNLREGKDDWPSHEEVRSKIARAVAAGVDADARLEADRFLTSAQADGK
jgi:hypothetical protein